MSLKRAKEEINNDEFVFRRVRHEQIDEFDNPVEEAYSLRVLRRGEEESYLSVNLERLTTPNLAVGNKKINRLYKFPVSSPRKMLLGVAHSPSINDYSHTAVCGFFTDSKVKALIKDSQRVL